MSTSIQTECNLNWC